MKIIPNHHLQRSPFDFNFFSSLILFKVSFLMPHAACVRYSIIWCIVNIQRGACVCLKPSSAAILPFVFFQACFVEKERWFVRNFVILPHHHQQHPAAQHSKHPFTSQRDTRILNKNTTSRYINCLKICNLKMCIYLVYKSNFSFTIPPPLVNREMCALSILLLPTILFRKRFRAHVPIYSNYNKELFM